jgi:hypothetical protein
MVATLEDKTHVWEGLTQYHLDEKDIFNLVEGGIEGTIEILKKMKPNQYHVAKTMPSEIINTNTFDDYLNNLKSLGLDIGKGNCEYGYKMPLPEKGEDNRKLIIFKRK